MVRNILSDLLYLTSKKDRGIEQKGIILYVGKLNLNKIFLKKDRGDINCGPMNSIKWVGCVTVN